MMKTLLLLILITTIRTNNNNYNNNEKKIILITIKILDENTEKSYHSPSYLTERHLLKASGTTKKKYLLKLHRKPGLTSSLDDWNNFSQNFWRTHKHQMKLILTFFNKCMSILEHMRRYQGVSMVVFQMKKHKIFLLYQLRNSYVRSPTGISSRTTVLSRVNKQYCQLIHSETWSLWWWLKCLPLSPSLLLYCSVQLANGHISPLVWHMYNLSTLYRHPYKIYHKNQDMFPNKLP